MIKTALFDLDGTLLDSNRMWKTLGERYILSLGKTPASNLSERLWELSLKDAARLIKSEYEIPFSEGEIIGQVMKICAGFYKNEVKAKKGARELLEQLSERNIEMKIVTSSSAELAEAALERFGFLRFFSDIIGSADKSTPDIFMKSSENPCQTLVFEDALYAVKTAKAAGFITCAVYDFSEKNAEELRQTADFYENTLYCYVNTINDIFKAAEKK